MSTEMIKDGIGSGTFMGVTPVFRALTASVSFGIADMSGAIGNAFSIYSGALSATSANLSAWFYLAPTNQLQSCYIADLRVSFGKSNSPGSALVTIYQNITGGTVISGAGGTLTPINRNFAKATPFAGTARYGAEAATATGGNTLTAWNQADNTIVTGVIGGWWLPAGTNIAIAVTPPAGNNSMAINITAIVAFLSTYDIMGYNVG